MDFPNFNSSVRYFEAIDQNSTVPIKATKGSAGYDLYVEKEVVNIPPHIQLINGNLHYNKPVLISTGVRAIFPSDEALLIFPRSSLFKRYGLMLTNSVGVVDSDYNQEIFISVINMSSETVIIPKGERIAQGVFIKYQEISYLLGNISSDMFNVRTGGFGSTGYLNA